MLRNVLRNNSPCRLRMDSMNKFMNFSLVVHITLRLGYLFNDGIADGVHQMRFTEARWTVDKSGL